MTRSLRILRSGPQVTVQDLGRPGYLAQGLSRGGAADRLAVAEGAALLGQHPGLAVLEFAGFGAQLQVTEPMRAALTGAPMIATLGDRAVEWNTGFTLHPGDVLDVGAAKTGVYGYLSVAGGIDSAPMLGSRAVHLVAGLGTRLEPGDVLPVGPDPVSDRPPMRLTPEPRFQGGEVRIVPGAQTALYDAATRIRFEATAFTRDARGNRQGVQLAFNGAPFEVEGQRTILSEVIVPGDIQMTGDGVPFVLLPECQTTGGYPRIGSVLPEDLPIVAQAMPGAPLRFTFLDIDSARRAHLPEPDRFAAVAASAIPAVRDPRDMQDLLHYQLISGVTAGADTSGKDR
ncbi:MAG: urea amidolyase [Pseudomonadota bacterium]